MLNILNNSLKINQIYRGMHMSHRFVLLEAMPLIYIYIYIYILGNE